MITVNILLRSPIYIIALVVQIKKEEERGMDYLAGKLMDRLPRIMEDIAKLDKGQSSIMHMMFPNILSDDEMAVISGNKHTRSRDIYR
ncbi:MAG: hypothetical protein IJU93_00790 [Lachnospiraceae bacterium]|nr:hypothetical protein [Lachnospiraceae bacterium]